MIAVVGAMEEEVAEIKKYMDITSMQTIHGYTFYEGTIANTKVVVVQGGIGKVNAAISTTLLLTNYDIDFLINVGSAGGLSLSQNVGDVVISTGVLHHDVDVTAFQRELGEVPGMPRIFEPDKKALKLVENIFERAVCGGHDACARRKRRFHGNDPGYIRQTHHFGKFLFCL